MEEIYYVTKNICTSLKSAEKLVNEKRRLQKERKNEKIIQGKKIPNHDLTKTDTQCQVRNISTKGESLPHSDF